MTSQGLFAGKVVVVTGASSGIGRAAALGFSREGASVVLVSRDAVALAAVAAEAAGPTAVVAADVTADDTPARVVGEAVAQYGGIDVLVNAAGIIGTASTDQTPDELFDRMMAINVRAPFRLMREAYPQLKARRGNVVNVSSVNGLRAFAGVAVYCSSKAALDHLTRCAALDWAPDGVRVNCVNPGVTVTNLHRRGGMDDARYAAFLERAKETHPLGRPGQADEIADAVLFVASGKAAWMTGDTIAVDGGRHLTCLR
ncbi:MAG: glucose 1-dehydrogenase [Acidobacteria bacterium]|nr:glucose 1-dehydrogenase [Acidobacteriota bacterium]